MMPRLLLLSALMFAAQGAIAADAEPAPHQVLGPDETTGDARHAPLKDLNGHFPFEVPESLEAWEQRADQLKRRILVSCGLWPLPERTPLNAMVFGQSVRDGFTVEKVAFESVPGHWVTGLLFRPESRPPGTRSPAVLCPHGHGGRLEDRGVQGVRHAIVNGEERFEESGRFPALARCAQLARMGCVTFIYDMIGYGDSIQIPFDVAHRAAQHRPDMEGTDAWGFYSMSAELRSQSILGLQMWNSVRSLDFLASLEDVDPARIAVTGNSGGGTQTLLLCAVDPRPIAAFPNGMVSTSMQGGCYCENAPLLRVGTGNVELTALFAPKPVGMTAVDDWTRDMMTDGYPQLQKLYALYGKQDSVLCVAYPHFPHNYNYVTRGLMYRFFNKHMGLGHQEPIVEEDYRLLSPEEYHVWGAEHPKPEGGPEYERRLLKQMAEASDAQLAAMKQADPEAYANLVRGFYATVVGREVPAADSITWEARGESRDGDVIIDKGILQYAEQGERVPTLRIRGTSEEAPRRCVVYLAGNGKSAVFNEDGTLSDAVREQISSGAWVLAIDLFGAGENAVAGIEEESQRLVDDDRPYAGFTFGYNPTRFARRVHDVMSALRYANDAHPDASCELVASGAAAPVAAVTRALVGNLVDQATIDAGEFRFASLTSFRDANFLPGAVKFGDLPAVLELP